MGHVDHGKTSLLDAIRKTNVAGSEYGQITQHTGAYMVERNRKKITFLDTPGHEAFTAMRARGAQVTDIVVLVVAADDGVMPQTMEALNHARAAGVRIIVAITKTDLANANVVRVKGQLMQQGVRIEEYGGTTICLETSVPKKVGIKELLEAILLTALELDLKSVQTGAAHGVVLEARMDKGRGNLATVLIQEGSLHRGDAFVCGEHYGKVRDMMSDSFVSLPQALPSMPVQVLGFSGLPEPGERFDVVANEREARETGSRRAMEKRERILSAAKPKLTLEAIQERIVEGQVRELRIVLKADMSGSAEALKDSLEGQSLDEVRVRVMHSGVGAVNVSDVVARQGVRSNYRRVPRRRTRRRQGPGRSRGHRNPYLQDYLRHARRRPVRDARAAGTGEEGSENRQGRDSPGLPDSQGRAGARLLCHRGQAQA